MSVPPSLPSPRRRPGRLPHSPKLSLALRRSSHGRLIRLCRRAERRRVRALLQAARVQRALHMRDGRVRDGHGDQGHGGEVLAQGDL